MENTTTEKKNWLIIGPNYAKEVLPLIEESKINIKIFMYDWRWYKQDVACDISRINTALIRAQKRGVKVQAIVNYQAIISQLRECGIDVKLWEKSKAMHAKCIIIDEWLVVLGSHNLTENAMGLNVEISNVVADENMALQAGNYFNSIWSSLT